MHKSLIDLVKAPPKYGWFDWEEDEEREGVYFLTISTLRYDCGCCDAGCQGEEIAVIVHRTCGGRFPLTGEAAMAKVEQAKMIVAALNAYKEN